MRQPAMFPAKSGLPRALEAAFARFWAAYPQRRPNPRALAEKEFARVIKAGATAEMLTQAAAAYAAEVKALSLAEQFIVHAATFLRQARYVDYLAAHPDTTPETPAEPAHALWPFLRGHLDLSTFRAWIGRCQVVANGEDQIVLKAPSRIVADRVWNEHRGLIERATGRPLVMLEIPR